MDDLEALAAAEQTGVRRPAGYAPGFTSSGRPPAPATPSQAFAWGFFAGFGLYLSFGICFLLTLVFIYAYGQSRRPDPVQDRPTYSAPSSPDDGKGLFRNMPNR